jgi:hypothetical protein
LTNYSEMSPEARFAEINRLATQLFETERWKTSFADRYGIKRQTVGGWMREGAPVWACVALADAVAAKNWQTVRAAVLEAEGATSAASAPAQA